MITVVHIKQHPDAVYCGRACCGLMGSALANPYKIGRDGTREEVIMLYSVWLHQQIRRNNEAVMNELYRLADLALQQDVQLGCWCRRDGTNTPCHCDHIKRQVETILHVRNVNRLILGL